jgi:hypothetical protein
MKDKKGHHMPRYAITETAGRFVAGTNNTGVGTVLTLTEKQAEHEVRLGTLRLLDVNTDAPEHTAEASTGDKPDDRTAPPAAAQRQATAEPKTGDSHAKNSKERGM